MRNLLILLAFVLLASAANAQRARNAAWKKYRHEVGGGFGYNNLFASLGESDQLGFNTALQRSTFNANYRFFILKFLSVKASVTHGYARKNDKGSEQVERPNNLRIDYKSSISEFAGIVEFHLLDEVGVQKLGARQRRARGGLSKGVPFGVSAYTGIAFNIIRPYGEYFGDEVELKPLGSNPGVDPNNSSYDRSHFHIPLGVNFRIIVDKNWRLGVDLGYRLGFSDYIDNVSGVYYTEPDASSDPGLYEDRSFVGVVTYGDSQDPVTNLAGDNGRSSYFMAFLTLSYRIRM